MSTEVTKDVRSKGEVVGQVNITVYDNVDEACDGLTDEKCLDLINRGHAIEVMDAKRREVTGSTSTGIRDLMKKCKDNPGLLDKIKALAEAEGLDTEAV